MTDWMVKRSLVNNILRFRSSTKEKKRQVDDTHEMGGSRGVIGAFFSHCCKQEHVSGNRACTTGICNGCQPIRIDARTDHNSQEDEMVKQEHTYPCDLLWLRRMGRV